ncbi:hypothetical protein AcW1_003940 [Taiwanofungus camphoratus]|nr:hypothetical protein AcV5_003889 [Antrodia cinnamomea]KAI0937905.1 hypothetical protein AcW1_003940 [Antrodia cinnamomea]
MFSVPLRNCSIFISVREGESGGVSAVTPFSVPPAQKKPAPHATLRFGLSKGGVARQNARLKCKERDDVEVRGSVCSCMFLATSSSPRRFRLVWNEIGRSQPILRRKPSGPWGDLMTTTISTRHSRCSGAFGRILQTDCIPARPTSSCNNIEIVRLIQDAKAGYWRS